MDSNERLIDEIRRRTILYDLTQADYKNLKKKKYAWREVAASLQLNELECKKRWKGLRDSYKRCKRMKQDASGSSVEAPKKKWRYFEAMRFLDNASSSRSTIDENISNDMIKSEIDDISEENSADSFLSPVSQCSTPVLREMQKNDSDKFQDFLEFAASSISETCGAVTNQKQDPTALLFVSLAAKIKESQMPLSMVNKIEAKVSSLVFAEISSFYSSSANTPEEFII